MKSKIILVVSVLLLSTALTVLAASQSDANYTVIHCTDKDQCVVS